MKPVVPPPANPSSLAALNSHRVCEQLGKTFKKFLCSPDPADSLEEKIEARHFQIFRTKFLRGAS